MRWHILTGEYPMTPGGVSDYTRILATRLAELGDEVHVWTPSPDARWGERPAAAAGATVTVHELEDHWGPLSLRRVGKVLKAEREPFQLLIQYVPHMYGWKGMNVLFAAWIAGLRGFQPWTLFHEVAFPLETLQKFRHRFLSHMQRWMAGRVMRGTARCLVSIPGWQQRLEDISKKSVAVEWLPVPSNVATEVNPERVAAIRRTLDPNGLSRVLGHFGTHGGWIADEVAKVIDALLSEKSAWIVLLIGRGGSEFRARLITAHPEFEGRVVATGALDAGDVAAHLAAADLLYQPYPDGISSRRGSAMAGLALGLPIVTNAGAATEPDWERESWVKVVDVRDTRAVVNGLTELAADSKTRLELGARARKGYARHFSWERHLATLRGGGSRE